MKESVPKNDFFSFFLFFFFLKLLIQKDHFNAVNYNSFTEIEAADIVFFHKSVTFLYETLCLICYHLHNLKNVKNLHRGALFLVKLQS